MVLSTRLDHDWRARRVCVLQAARRSPFWRSLMSRIREAKIITVALVKGDEGELDQLRVAGPLGERTFAVRRTSSRDLESTVSSEVWMQMRAGLMEMG